MDDRALVEQQLGRPPRAFRRVAARCPDGSPAVTEQWPYDDAGDPFPTTYYLTCPHLVAAVARLEAAGGVERWSEEVERDPALAADLERATEEQRRIRRELAGGKVGPDGGSSLELGIGGSANPRRLKCLHAHVGLRARAAGLPPRRADPGRARPTLAAAVLPRIDGMITEAEVESARREWEEGHRRLHEQARQEPQPERLLRQVDTVVAELRRRVGGTFTLAELAAAYAGAERWSRAAVAEHSPAPGWPRTLSLVEAAAFHEYARGAQDYEP